MIIVRVYSPEELVISRLSLTLFSLSLKENMWPVSWLGVACDSNSLIAPYSVDMQFCKHIVFLEI